MAPLISELVNQAFRIYKSNQEINWENISNLLHLYQMAPLIIELFNQTFLIY